jgi:hypothetical protein
LDVLCFFLCVCFFLLSLIPYLISSILERIFKPTNSLYWAPCSCHLDKAFSSRANSEFVHSGALEFSPSVFLLPYFTVNTKGCRSPILFFSNPVTESFVPSLPQTDPIAQFLLTCANITRSISSPVLNLSIVHKSISCTETTHFLRESSLDPKV